MNLNLGPKITSTIRIGIAAGIGAGTRILVNKYGIDVDGETLTAVTTAAFGSAWYGLARYVEERWPSFRILGLSNPESQRVRGIVPDGG